MGKLKTHHGLLGMLIGIVAYEYYHRKTGK